MTDINPKIAGLKNRLRTAILTHRRLARHLDCGSNLAATINPDVSKAAQDANKIAAELKQIDPNFPASWSPIPEGK